MSFSCSWLEGVHRAFDALVDSPLRQARANTRRAKGCNWMLVATLAAACGAETGPNQGDFGGDDEGFTSSATTSGANGTTAASTSRDVSSTSRPNTSTSSSAPSNPTSPTIPVAPSKPKKFVGNITTRGQVGNGFAQMWNQITPENESKWEAVEPVKGQLNWSQVDAIYNYAKQNDILFKLHAFVWGSQQPNWVSSTFGDELAGRVENFMQEACTRYPDVAMIDVVNEPPPHTDPSQVREALGGAGASGYDWIVNAFKLARKHCPNAVLILNDYNNIEWPMDQDNFIKIATAVKNAGAPVDALGAQAHDAYMKSTSELKSFIDKLAGVGLPLYITEYDIDEGDDEKQKRIISEQFPLFWNDDRIKGITLWGYVHGSTWKQNTGLVRNGTDRPAMTWLKQYLSEQGAR